MCPGLRFAGNRTTAGPSMTLRGQPPGSSDRWRGPRVQSLLCYGWDARGSPQASLTCPYCLLISCFVSAVVTRASNVSTSGVRRDSPMWDRLWGSWLQSCQSSLFTGRTVRATWDFVFSPNLGLISRWQKEKPLKISFLFCFSHPNGKCEYNLSI